MEFRDAVASAGLYANNLHLIPDRQPDQHLVIQMLFLTPDHSIKAHNFVPYLCQFIFSAML